MKVLEIEGLTPLVFGYGKPFVQGSPGAYDADSLAVPLPHTVAGAFRNQIARSMGWFDYSDAYRDRLLSVSVRGPILQGDSGLLFPSPADCVHVEVDGQRKRACGRPCSEGDGVWLPEGLKATRLGQGADYEPSKEEHTGFWSEKDSLEWLLQPKAEYMPHAVSGLSAVPMDTRTHVALDSARRSHQSGQLFATKGACYGPAVKTTPPHLSDAEWKLLDPESARTRAVRDASISSLRLVCEVDAEEEFLSHFEGVLTLGGYRGLAVARKSERSMSCPDEFNALFKDAKRVRIQLATPGAFDQGWKPSLESVRKNTGVDLEIVSASVGRRVAASGWQTVAKGTSRIKPIRWLAPAGSVYFCEVRAGDPSSLAGLWLTSVSDQEQDRKDGFGLALWGIWDYV